MTTPRIATLTAMLLIALTLAVNAGEKQKRAGLKTIRPAMATAKKGTRAAGLAAHYFRDASNWNGHWPSTSSTPDVKAQAWTFTKYAYTRIEPLVNHQFIRRGWFSVRWQGTLDTSPKGKRDREAEYTFSIWADDGCRLTIDGKTIINDWRPCSETAPDAVRTATVTLKPGKHKIVIEYFQGLSHKKKDRDPMKLYWQCKARAIPKQIIPAAHFSHDHDDLTPQPGRADKTNTGDSAEAKPESDSAKG